MYINFDFEVSVALSRLIWVEMHIRFANDNERFPELSTRNLNDSLKDAKSALDWIVETKMPEEDREVLLELFDELMNNAKLAAFDQGGKHAVR